MNKGLRHKDPTPSIEQLEALARRPDEQGIETTLGYAASQALLISTLARRPDEQGIETASAFAFAARSRAAAP